MAEHTLILSSDTGVNTGADIRQVAFTIPHDRLFPFDTSIYSHFEIELISANERNTATAGTSTNVSRVGLLRVSTAVPNATNIFDAYTYITYMMNLTATANLYTKYYSSTASAIRCRFNPGMDYQFLVTLTGGVTAANILDYTGNMSYLPIGWLHVYRIHLVPKTN